MVESNARKHVEGHLVVWDVEDKVDWVEVEDGVECSWDFDGLFFCEAGKVPSEVDEGSDP